MAIQVTVSYGGQVVAGGLLDAAQGRISVDLPPLPAETVEGTLQLTPQAGEQLGVPSVSCISEWVRCGEADRAGNGAVIPVTLNAAGVFGSRDRAFESTIYLSSGAGLLRIGLKVPTLVVGAFAPPPGAIPASPPSWTAPAVPAAPPTGTPPFTSAPPAAAPPAAPFSGAPPAGEPPAVPYAGPPAGSTPAQAPFGAPGAVPPPTGPPGWGEPGTPQYPPGPSAYPAPPPGSAPGTYPAQQAAPQVVPGMCCVHPDVETPLTCARCHNSFCSQCLVDVRGVSYCGWCKAAVLYEMQRRTNNSNNNPVNVSQVLFWAKVYNGALALSGVASIALQSIFLSSLNDFRRTYSAATGGSEIGTAFAIIIPIVALLLSLPPLFGMKPGNRWAYIWQAILLLPSALLSCFWISCFSFLLWPGAIALFVYWMKPEVKAYFETPTG